MNTSVFVGAPLFYQGIKPVMKGPVSARGQIQKMYATYWSRSSELKARLGCEYLAILLTLQKMGVPFQIILPDRRLLISEIIRNLSDRGFTFAEFPDIDVAVLTFPRDLGVMVGTTTLINDCLTNLCLPPEMDGRKILRSPYGEGGRLLYRKNTALVSNRYYRSEDIKTMRDIGGRPAHTDSLRELGCCPATLPLPVTFYQEEGGRVSFNPDDHPDRHYALVEDRCGELHLFVDPGIQSGLRGVFQPPAMSSGRTLEELKKICAKISIRLHIPQKLRVFGSINFMQFQDGRILMTGGEPELQGELEELVGKECVHPTPLPIQFHPAFLQGGIRCLITELPNWVSNLSPFVNESWLSEHALQGVLIQ